MKTLLQVGLLALSVVAVTVVSGMYSVQAVKSAQNWCIHTDIGNKDICGYHNNKDCKADRDNNLQTYPDVTKCFKQKAA
jgi:hypothetical protein